MRRQQRGGRGGWGGGRATVGGGGLTPWVTNLILANGALFILGSFGLLPLEWQVFHLGFSPRWILQQPWTPLTYMFVHGGLGHVFINMLILYFFGPPLERAWGSEKFVKYYAVAGLGGALFSLVLSPLVGTAPVVGASGAIYGVMLAFALNWPEVPVYIWGILPVKSKWLVAGMAFFSFYSTLTGQTGGVAEWAHLGGLVTGYLFLRLYWNGPSIGQLFGGGRR